MLGFAAGCGTTAACTAESGNSNKAVTRQNLDFIIGAFSLLDSLSYGAKLPNER